MRRQIISQSQVGSFGPTAQADDYADRLVKMIPAEIVSLYLFYIRTFPKMVQIK